MPSGSITHAFIRCTRQDREAEGLFELTRPDLGLWILELNYTQGGQQAEQIAEICRHLQVNSVRLQKLNEGSADYTLHFTFDLPECERIVFPHRFPHLPRRAASFLRFMSKTNLIW